MMMKKMIAYILMLVMMTSTVTIMAANGDVIGHIYATDIRSYINGVEVQSYNIGGKTVVVIEEILKEAAASYSYDDSSRALKLFSLRPYVLVEKTEHEPVVPGKVLGNIYETDIKTSVYDVLLPTYNLGGKTAVAIEDLGCDGAFSPIGGKYIWNETDRTIHLEFLYEALSPLSNDINIRIRVNETMTEAVATFEEALHCNGHSEFIEFPVNGANMEAVLPIKAQGEIIGYYFHRPLKDNQFTAFTYYYPEKFKEAEKTYTPDPNKTREDIVAHFINYHCVGGPRARFDTENYSFVFISVAGTSWTSYNLLQAYDDGTYVDYGNIISTRNRSPQNLVIDEENEKVTFKYVDRYNSEWFTNYEIDLKTGQIKEVK